MTIPISAKTSLNTFRDARYFEGDVVIDGRSTSAFSVMAADGITQLFLIDAVAQTVSLNTPLSFGSLSLTDATSKIVPGATAFVVRNHADSTNNFLISDDGTSLQVATGGDSYNSDAHTISLTLAGLTATYANTLTAFDSAFNTDTGTVDYTGIIRGGMSHVNVFITGGTISTLESHAAVVNITASSTGGTINGGYGCTGEWLFQDGATTNATGTIYAAKGSMQLLGASTVATAYAGHFALNDTLAKAGTFTTPIGARGYVEHNATTTWGGAATGVTGEVFQVGAGTITGLTTGVQGWVHNTGNATYTGAVSGLWGIVALTGAAVTSGTVYGAFANLTFAGTAVGGTANAALNAEIQNSGTSTTTQGIIGVNVRWRVNNASLTQTLAVGINVMAPNLTALSTTTTGYGVRINDQSTATGTVTTSYGLRIENQAAVNANAYALYTAGGRVQFNSTNGSALFTSASQPLTVSTTTSGTLAISSAALLTLTGTSISIVGKITSYNNVATLGWGQPAIYGYTRVGTTTNATATLATYTVGASDGSFIVSANLNVTTSTTVAATVTCVYTDETNVSRTLTLPFTLLAGSPITAITTAQGNVPYEGIPLHIRCKASTTITIATAGTVTAFVYTGEGLIQQVA